MRPRHCTPPLLPCTTTTTHVLLPKVTFCIIPSPAQCVAQASGSAKHCGHVLKLHQRLLQHEFTLPEHAVRRAVANFGDRRRLVAFVRKLLAGVEARPGMVGGVHMW